MKLNYPTIIRQDKGYTALAELSNTFPSDAVPRLLTNIIDKLENTALPLMAVKLGIDGDKGLSFTENEQEARIMLKDAVLLNRIRGTPNAIKHFAKLLQFGEVDIQEASSANRYNGKYQYNNRICYGTAVRNWYEYRIIIDRPVPKEKVAKLKQMLPLLAPARCRLVEVKTKEPIKYNGLHQYNGEFTFGSY